MFYVVSSPVKLHLQQVQHSNQKQRWSHVPGPRKHSARSLRVLRRCSPPQVSHPTLALRASLNVLLVAPVLAVLAFLSFWQAYVRP